MGTTTDKTTYLNNTKLKIKDGINRLGGELTNLNTFRSYANALDSIYNALPKVTDTGSNISLSPTLKGALGTIPLGNCEQNGTPTPDTPQPIKVVTGDNEVVVQNKNLIDLLYALIQYTINATTGELMEYYSNSAGENYIPVLPNTSYTFSVNTIVNNIRLSEYRKDKTHIQRNNQEHSNKITITTTANTYYLRWSLNYNNDTMTQAIIDSLDLQLKYGSTATSYVPHQEQSITLHLGDLELCKIGDYQDYITGTKNNWKVVKNIQELSVDNNTEITTSSTNTSGIIRLQIPVTSILRPSGNGVVGQILATHYLKKSSSQTYLNNVGISIDATANRIFIYDTNYNTSESVTSFKQWAETNNLTIYYILATSTEIPITDTTLINELNELQDLLSYDGTTNITITSDSNNAQMLVQVSALKGE